PEEGVGPDPTPVLTTVTVTLPATSLEAGQAAVTATAAGADQHGAAFTLGPVSWTSSAPAVASVNNGTGVVTPLSAGTTDIIATTAGKAGQRTLTVVAPAALKINEIESNGGTPGDWAELFNPTAAAVNISGWVVKDNDDTHIYTIPAGTTIAAGGYFVAEEAGFGFGLGAADAVRLYSPFGVLVDSHSWTAHAATTLGRCANGTGAFTTSTSSTKGAANDCSVAVKVNEVESSGGTPGDWIELINNGGNTADLSGFIVRDNDDTHTYTLPAGSTIAPGAYLVVEEAALGFGLGGADAARLFTPTGTLVDSFTWDAHAAITYGRCPNGTGALINTAASTKGAANNCVPTGPVSMPWPGDDNVQTVDGLSVFQTNLSGLTYEGAAGAAPAVLWAVRNGPGTLFRLIFSGGIWTPDPANGWGAGKALKYLDGTGNPDTEGVTFAAGGSAGGMYVATERNNDASTISRSSILRIVPTGAGATLTATNDWNITADLPVVGANLGIEAITWVPDAFLTSKGFFDESKGRAYAPADYPDHGTGIFFVGVEGNGNVYAYALNHTNNTFTRVATFASGFTGVMALDFDSELSYLWIGCDDTCGGKYATFEVNGTGRFASTNLFDRPGTMPNLNNEGFAFAPLSECVANRRPVFWADDGETGGHSIRRTTITCTRFP
ncbi:MAG: cell wall protein, partial [Gemmatimonadales bacterium]|nr:cell wall protein [Gemmatimonadales bacterium]